MKKNDGIDPKQVELLLLERIAVALEKMVNRPQRKSIGAFFFHLLQDEVEVRNTYTTEDIQQCRAWLMKQYPDARYPSDVTHELLVPNLTSGFRSIIEGDAREARAQQMIAVLIKHGFWND